MGRVGEGARGRMIIELKDKRKIKDEILRYSKSEGSG